MTQRWITVTTAEAFELVELIYLARLAVRRREILGHGWDDRAWRIGHLLATRFHWME